MPQADLSKLAPSTNEQSPPLNSQPQCFYKTKITPTHREGRLGLAAPHPRAGRGREGTFTSGSALLERNCS